MMKKVYGFRVGEGCRPFDVKARATQERFFGKNTKTQRRKAARKAGGK